MSVTRDEKTILAGVFSRHYPSRALRRALAPCDAFADGAQWAMYWGQLRREEMVARAYLLGLRRGYREGKQADGDDV